MLKSTYTPLPPLPPGWTEHKAPTGHLYYYHAETKQSTYKRPSPSSTAIPPSLDTSACPSAVNPAGLPTVEASSYGFPSPFVGGLFGPPDNFNRNRKDFSEGRDHHDRRRRHTDDRPKSKHVIPGCAPWVLVKTKLGRRFVHNMDTKESYWKFPDAVLKCVVEYDRLEREKKDRGKYEAESDQEAEESKVSEPVQPVEEEPKSNIELGREVNEEFGDSDEYEEVEVTDDDDELHSKKLRIGHDGSSQPVEFNEDDIAYQLAYMGEDYGLDPGEYGEPGEEGWEEGAAGLSLTEDDSTALFRDLLDDFRINPYTPWEKVIEDGRIIDDPRYTVLPNMKSRREVWATWSRDRIQELKEQKEREEKKDPRIRYLIFLQEHAAPKLYWPEFKRKYRKEPEMKDSQLSDREREKFYREHIAQLKLPESTRKSDFSALLKSTPLHVLNMSSTADTLPVTILTDLRYISLPPKIRDPLIEAYILTLPPAPGDDTRTEEQEEQQRKRLEREKRKKALADRESKVQEEKRKQRGALIHGKNMLRQGEAEIGRALQVGKEGLRSHLESQAESSSFRLT